MKRSFTSQSTTVLGGASKRTRSFAARKKFARSKSKNNDGRLVVRGGTGMPKMLQIHHRYVQPFAITGTAGALGVQQFRCNGMFDPDVTGAGHQPMYFDSMAALYDHYTVIGAKIKVTVTFASGTVGIVTGLFVNDDATVTTTTASSAGELPSGIVRWIGASSPSAPQVQFEGFWSAKKTFGGDPLSNDNLQGTSAADPTEQSLWCIFAQSQDLSGTVAVQGLAEIEYIAVWDELRDLAQQ